jgi:hypothetical protein
LFSFLKCTGCPQIVVKTGFLKSIPGGRSFGPGRGQGQGGQAGQEGAAGRRQEGREEQQRQGLLFVAGQPEAGYFKKLS